MKNKFDTLVESIVSEGVDVESALNGKPLEIYHQRNSQAIDINDLPKILDPDDRDAYNELLKKVYEKGAGLLWKMPSKKMKTGNVNATVRPLHDGSWEITFKASGTVKYKTYPKSFSISFSVPFTFAKDGTPKLSAVGNGRFMGPDGRTKQFSDVKLGEIKKELSKKVKEGSYYND